jgi:hypothetical protein
LDLPEGFILIHKVEKILYDKQTGERIEMDFKQFKQNYWIVKDNKLIKSDKRGIEDKALVFLIRFLKSYMKANHILELNAKNMPRPFVLQKYNKGNHTRDIKYLATQYALNAWKSKRPHEDIWSFKLSEEQWPNYAPVIGKNISMNQFVNPQPIKPTPKRSILDIGKDDFEKEFDELMKV